VTTTTTTGTIHMHAKKHRQIVLLKLPPIITVKITPNVQLITNSLFLHRRKNSYVDLVQVCVFIYNLHVCLYSLII